MIGRVSVDGYTYWTDIEVETGDTVEVSVGYPWSEIFGKTKTGQVIGKGDGNYKGILQTVIRKVQKVN